KAQTGWSFWTDHPVRAFQRTPSAISFDGTATPPVPGGDYAVAGFRFIQHSMFRSSCTALLLLLLLLCCFTPVRAQTTNDLFDGDVLHEVRLEINPKDWQALKANPSSNTYYPANFKWRNVQVDNVGIRSRGGSTRNSIKPGLRIDFNQYEANQQFL